MGLRILVFTILLFGFGFLLQSCTQNVITSEPANETVAQKISAAQKCVGVVCGENQFCNTGSCVCKAGFRKCNDSCISNDSCCGDGDCDYGKFCSENKCRNIVRKCNYGEVWNSDNESCACASNTKFCELQSKCIPLNHCCVPSDCSFRRDLCLQTNNIVTVCVDDGSIHCKGVIEGRDALFSLANTDLRIKVTKIFEDSGVSVIIGKNESAVLEFNASQSLKNNISVYVEQIKSAGGVCKTYQD